MTKLRIWTCTDHEGHWTVGSASVVVAETEDQARVLLVHALRGHGIVTTLDKFTLTEIEMYPHAIVLNDGSY